MTFYDDPNREAVGLEPIWTGAGEEPELLTTEQQPPAPASGFDPAEHTVAEVEEYVAKHPDKADAVLTAEAAGKNRTTLTGG